jgi:hypothetical protein
MSNFPIIYAATSLVLIYLYLSMIASILQEWIAQALALRSKTLRAGVGTLLSDPDVVGLAHQLFDHSLIKSITSKASGPSYIPSPMFASALLDLVAPNQPGGPANVFASVRSDIAAIPSNSALAPVRNSLLTLADNSNGDLSELRNRVSTWFDNAMDRVSGKYKRCAQIILFFIGFVLAAILNADTFDIARIASTPQSTAATAQVLDDIQRKNLSADLAKANSSTRLALLGTLTPVLPLGGAWSNLPTDRIGWLQKVIGILLTAFMVSLGAPFWFDILDSIMNVRAAGPRPPDPQRPSG